MSDDTAHADVLTAAAQNQIRSIVERLERLEREKAEIAAQIKEVMAEAKGNGFSPKILRKAVSIRKQDRAKRQEEEAILDLYMGALGEAPLFERADPQPTTAAHPSGAIVKWLGGRDTGASSKALALAALGEMPARPTYPSDASDFGRCHRLLAEAPEAKAGLAKLGADGGPYWGALVAKWDAITAAYLAEDEPGGKGATYDLLRSILTPIEDEDRNVVRLSPGVTMRMGA